MSRITEKYWEILRNTGWKFCENLPSCSVVATHVQTNEAALLDIGFSSANYLLDLSTFSLQSLISDNFFLIHSRRHPSNDNNFVIIHQPPRIGWHNLWLLSLRICSPGGDLFERVSKPDYTLTEEKCRIFMRQIIQVLSSHIFKHSTCVNCQPFFQGLEFLHGQNIVHLDIKPYNILFSRSVQ